MRIDGTMREGNNTQHAPYNTRAHSRTQHTTYNTHTHTDTPPTHARTRTHARARRRRSTYTTIRLAGGMGVPAGCLSSW